MWKGKTYQFTSLVQGLAISPRIFTKITKVFFSTLRKQGHPNVNYIDDSLLQGDSEKMVVKLTSEKVAKICINCEKLLKTPSIVIRELAEIIWKLIACGPACEHAMLFTNRLEIQKKNWIVA